AGGAAAARARHAPAHHTPDAPRRGCGGARLAQRPAAADHGPLLGRTRAQRLRAYAGGGRTAGWSAATAVDHGRTRAPSGAGRRARRPLPTAARGVAAPCYGVLP